MSLAAEDTAPAAEHDDIRQAARLLGGARVLRHSPGSPLEAHELLMRGLPGESLTYLLDHLRVLRRTTSLEKAIGISLRTFQRRQDAPARPLSREQSARTWTFAKTLAKATAVFGAQEAAERWLEQPATGLDRHRPIDLLATPEGVELVETFLGRLEYGVYA